MFCCSVKYPAGLSLKEMAFHHINVIMIAGETSDAEAIKETAVCTRRSEVMRTCPRCTIEGASVFTFRPASLFLDVLEVL